MLKIGIPMFTRSTRLLFFSLSLASLSMASLPGEVSELPDLESLSGVHPRLFVTADDFQALQERQWDSLGERYLEFLHDSGEAMLGLPPVAHELYGYRMLAQSNRILKRIATWSLLYRMEGDTRYRDAAIRELENATAFSDWNPQHFLDVGELSLAVAIGTDWLWDELSTDQRDRFLEAMKTKAIEPSLDESDPLNWWLYYYNNWNPVCHSGLTASALLLAEREPELAARVMDRSMRAFPYALESYHQDGAYPEGPGYWDYGTNFACLFLNLIDRAFGSTLGLDEDPAFRASATYRAMVVTPTGKFYNYADGSAKDRFAVATAWFASQYGDPAGDFEMRRGLENWLDRGEWEPEDNSGRLMPFLALWYPDSAEASTSGKPRLPKTWLGRGPNPVAFVREGFTGPDDFFLGFKGNDGSVSHAHLDAGSFILEDEGVRWAVDLGSQNYGSIEKLGFGLWDRRQYSDRWRVFRLGSYSHNVLLIDQRMQGAEVKANITSLDRQGDLVEGAVDLLPVYFGQAKSYRRTFRIHDFSVVEIIDRVRGARERTQHQGRTPATLRWRMLTEAEVTVEDHEAILRQDGKTLRLVVAEPAGGYLRAAPVDPPPNFWDAANPGVTAIDFWCQATDFGDQDVRVVMSTDFEALDRILEE